MTALAVWRRDIGSTRLAKRAKTVKMMWSVFHPLRCTLWSRLLLFLRRPNSLARVTGTIKTFGSKKYFNATQLRPVRDANELFFHLLDAMVVQLTFDRGPVGHFSPRLHSMAGLMTRPARFSSECTDVRSEWGAIVVCVLRRAGSSIRSEGSICTPSARPAQYCAFHAESTAEARRRSCQRYRKSRRRGCGIYRVRSSILLFLKLLMADVTITQASSGATDG